MINVFEPTYDERENSALASVLDSRWTGRGSLVSKFEALFAKHIGVGEDNIITTNSASEALFQIANLENWKKDDEVLVPSISFIAAATAVLDVGAQIKFIDVDKLSMNPTIEILNQSRTEKTKALILNNYGGMQKEILEIAKWCNSNGILLIEDSSCAINSKIQNNYLGTFGDYGVWSLDSMKLISAGDGGIIYSKSTENANLLRERMYLGLKNKTSGLSGAMTKQKWWEYNISGPYRRAIMNDITASIALVQLSKIGELVKKRNDIINYYAENLNETGDLKFDGVIGDFRSPYFFWLQTKFRNELAQYLLDQGIYTTFRYFPLHKIDYFNSKVSLSNSDVASETSLLLPLHANLTESQIEKIIDNISLFFKTKV